MLCNDIAFRILNDNLSNTASISSSDTNTITESSEVSEQASDVEEEMEHTVDPYQFEPVASDSDEDSYSVDSEEDSSERLLIKDW